MANNLRKSIRKVKSAFVSPEATYYGDLGITIEGKRQVSVPGRDGYVYVRLRSSTSELITALNDKVDLQYNLPVKLKRNGSIYEIIGVNRERYSTWDVERSSVPKHAKTHTFDKDGNVIGSDAVFISNYQFLPSLVTPFSSETSENVYIYPYLNRYGGNWTYYGNTGTASLIPYKPASGTSLVLISMDMDTGNPHYLATTGTYIDIRVTGTSQLINYIPSNIPSSVIPIGLVRLTPSTSTISWANVYDVRPHFSSPSTGTSNGGGSGIVGVVVQEEGVVQGTGTVFNFIGDNVSVSISGSVARVYVTGSSGGGVPSFVTGSIPYAGADGILTENNPLLWWDETYRGFRIGRSSLFNFADTFPIGITAKNADETISVGIYVYGTGSSGAPSSLWNGYRSRGTPTAPLPVRSGDIFASVVGRGYDGGSFAAQSRINFFANGDMVTGTYAPTGIDLLVIPSGSSAVRPQLTIYGDSVNQPTGSTYNIGGQPHTHTPAQLGIRETLSDARTYYVRTDGSDLNNGLANTSGGAFLTIQKAVDTVVTLDTNGQIVTIQVADGTYTGAVVLKNVTGFSAGGDLVIQGNSGTPNNVHINVTGTCFSGTNLSVVWDIKDMKLSGTKLGILCVKSNIRFTNINFATCGDHMVATNGGGLVAFGNYAVSGNAARHLWAEGGGTLDVALRTITFSNSPVFSTAFCYQFGASFINAAGMTFTNKATVTAKRYDIQLNSACFTNGGGATYFPGGTAGTTATGGQYA